MMTTIIVIEDETLIRDNIVEILNFENYETLNAKDGRQGLDLIRQYMPDLIICDVMLPQMDGYELLAELRNDPITRMIPFIFLTAKTDRVDIRRGMSLGADDYITKPFTREELLDAVVVRLRRHHDIIEEHESILYSAQRQLTQMVAHELRTPLISINMVQDIISSKIGSLSKTELQELLDMLGTGTRRMSHLVEQMVFTTQLEAGVLNRETVQTNGFPAQIWELLMATIGLARRFAIRNSSTPVRLDDRDRDATVWCDMSSLKHALAELITNAIVFSPIDDEVILSQWTSDEAVWISILDKGQGISSKKLEQALQPFKQIGRETQEQQGIGMGLPLARRIIEAHGGKMKVNSVVDKGTQVIVGLPIVRKQKNNSE
jgi:signal transduction histidine kinase